MLIIKRKEHGWFNQSWFNQPLISPCSCISHVWPQHSLKFAGAHYEFIAFSLAPRDRSRRVHSLFKIWNYDGRREDYTRSIFHQFNTHFTALIDIYFGKCFACIIHESRFTSPSNGLQRILRIEPLHLVNGELSVLRRLNLQKESTAEVCAVSEVSRLQVHTHTHTHTHTQKYYLKKKEECIRVTEEYMKST